MPQLSVSFNAIVAQPGMLLDNEASNRDIYSAIAAVNIPFGTLCEFTSTGTVQPVQDATTTTSFVPKTAGICIFDPLGVEQSYVTFQVPASSSGSSAVGWRAGMAVPLLRKGRVWVLGDASGTQLNYGAINVWHSSDATHNQGVFTFLAPSATSGAEIDVAPNCISMNPTLIGGTSGISVTDPFGNTFRTYAVEIDV